MSFNSGSLNVGTLEATFSLSAASAASSISSIINQTNTLKQSFATTNILNVSTTSAVANLNKATDSANLFKKALEFGGAILAIDLVAKAFDGVKSAALGTNAAIEQAQLKFTALSGSAQTAATLMGQLETLAAHSTFGLTQITAAAGGLEAFGVNVANIPPLLNAMQNAAAAAGGDMSANFSNLARILGELAGGLPLTERQIRQLVTAGIPLQPLADQLGITVNQLLDVGKTGIVTGDQLVAAFAKVYTSGNLGDFMQKQAGTFNGALALIKTNVSLAAATAFKPLFDVVSSLVVKFGEFVQTPTFNQWVQQISAGMTAVIGLFKELASILAPVGDAMAKFFGLDTGNISAQMAAVAQAKVDVGQYNAALQGSGAAANDSKAELQGYKDQVDAASAAILGLNGQLADNQVLLDANARSIAAVKNQYDPIIKSAEQSIKEINTPTADELSRKQQELQLDRDRANLELTKPDTSLFDARILSDQTTLDTMAPLDTSGYDTAISGYQAQIEALQQSISGLNTDQFDEKINSIKDKLAEPAPDTTGITNQLIGLNEALAGGTISQSAFNSQYGALSRQKQGIETKYTQDTTGLKGQLKLLEQQRSDQALANKETAQADRQRIADLNDQVKIQEKGRSDAQKADAKARKDLEDDIKREGNLRAQALAPYTAAMKTITDAQARNSSLDAAAAAQRALDVAPYQAALDKAKVTEDSLLAPLLAQKQTYDDNKTSLTEARQQQELAKSAAEGQATALKDAAANAKLLGENLNPPGGAAKASLPLGGGAATAALGVGANLGAQSTPSPFVQSVNDATDKLKVFGDWISGHMGDVQKLGEVVGVAALSFRALAIAEALADLADPMTAILGIGVALGEVYLRYPPFHDAINEIARTFTDRGFSAGIALVGADLTDLGIRMLDWVKTVGPPLLAQLDEWGKQFLAWIEPQIGPMLAKLGDLGTRLLGWAKDQLEPLGTQLLAWGEQFVAWVGPHVGPMLDELGKLFARGMDWVMAQLPGLTDHLIEWGDEFVHWIAPSIPPMLLEFGKLWLEMQVWIVERVPLIALNIAKWGEEFSAWVAGSAVKMIVELDNLQADLLTWIISQVPTIASKAVEMGAAIASGIKNGLENGLNLALVPLNTFVGGIVKAINKIGDWFGVGKLSSITFDGINIGGGASGQGLNPSAPNAGNFLAAGHGSWPGGPAVWGEAGRELVHQPGGGWSLADQPTFGMLGKGATVLPNHITEQVLAAGVPGFAGGLLGDVIGGAKHLLGDAVGKGESWLVDQASKLIPGLTLPGVFADLAPTIAGAAKDGIASLIGGLFGQTQAQSLGRASYGGSASAIVNAVKSVTDDPDIWLAMLMAVASEQRTLSGPFVDQLGGGPGRGPFQIEAGPGGSNVGMISEDDARDPVKAAQYMVGRFINAKRGPWGSDNETAGAMTAAAAEVGAAFLAGNPLGYDRSVVDAAYAMATQALAASSGRFVGPVPSGGGFMQPVDGPITQPWGQTGFYLEQGGFHDGVDFGVPVGTRVVADAGGTVDAAGWTNSGYGNWVHILTDNFETWTGHMSDVLASVGDTVQKGQLVGYSGNTGASTGPHVHWGAHRDGQSIDPFTLPGLADGAFFPANTPTLAMVGEGPSDEITAPVPMLQQALREVVRSEGGGTTITMVPNAVVINVGPRDDPRAAGADAWAGFEEKMRGSGRILTR